VHLALARRRAGRTASASWLAEQLLGLPPKREGALHARALCLARC
jgi:hypothetical protein